MNIVALVLAMICAGILGGAMGYYLEQPGKELGQDEAEKARTGPERPMFSYIVLGIGAALMVPLFLNMISSTLVSETLAATDANAATGKLLVIVGFALVAAVASRRFITSLTDRVIREVEQTKKEAQEAKKVAHEAEQKVEQVVEPENAPRQVPEGAANQPMARVVPDQLSEDEKKVLRVLFSSTYASRALSGIWRDADLVDQDADHALKSLAEKALVRQTSTEKGYERWSLTQAGRTAASAV